MILKKGVLKLRAEKPYVIFGQMLKEQRLRRKLSQRKVAEIVGMDRTSIANIEAGKQRIMLSHALKISWALGISLDQVNAQISSKDLYAQIARQPRSIKNVLEKVLSEVKVSE